MKPLQLVQRGRARCDFDAPFATEQTEGFQSVACKHDAVGFERTIRRVGQPFDFRRVEKSEGGVGHGRPPALGMPRGPEPVSAGILPASECWLFLFRNTPAGSRRSRTRWM